VLEFLIELGVELLFQGLGELVVESVVRVLGAPFARRDQHHPVVAGMCLLLLGALLGEISCWVWPHRIVGPGPYPGSSLLLSPVVNGVAADALGDWRERRGRPRSYLATFWGGALFAFGMAGARFLFFRL